MKLKGNCPVTQKEEIIEFNEIPCGTTEVPDLHLKGLMNSCSVRGREDCPYNRECPIYRSFPDNFRFGGAM